MTCVEIRNRVNRARPKYPNCLKSDQNIPPKRSTPLYSKNTQLQNVHIYVASLRKRKLFSPNVITNDFYSFVRINSYRRIRRKEISVNHQVYQLTFR